MSLFYKNLPFITMKCHKAAPGAALQLARDMPPLTTVGRLRDER